MQHWTWVILAALGLALRVIIIQTVSVGDNYYEGEFGMFTDLDYKVYLDATLYDSPYERHTYRYSPVLAYAVTPSYSHNQLFGKYLLAVLDVFAAYYFYKIFFNRKGDKATNKKVGLIISMFSYLNPFLMHLGTRGSCEGITMTLAASFWYFYFGNETHGNMSPQERIQKGLTERQPNKIRKYVSYVIFGLWVHFRVYPIIFVPLLIMHEYHSVQKNKVMHALKFTIEFGLVSGGVFLGLAAYFYHLYGYDFLYETYIYHIFRRDNRTSKSIFCLDMYLNFFGDVHLKPLYRVVFRSLPTVVMLVAFSFYFVKKRSVFYCQGFIMVYFVLYNKVITDQYYFWLFNSILLCLPETHLVQEKKYKQGIWFMHKAFLLMAPTMILWGVYKYKFESIDPEYNIFIFWVINVLNFVCQNYVMTSLICDQASLLPHQPFSPLSPQKVKGPKLD